MPRSVMMAIGCCIVSGLVAWVAPLQAAAAPVQADSIIQSTVQKRAPITFESGVRADVSCWLSATVKSVTDKDHPDAIYLRFISISSLFTVDQVALRHERFNGPVELMSSKPFRVRVDSVDPNDAKMYAAALLGTNYEETDSFPVGPLVIDIRPRSPMTWGQVKTEDDLEIVSKVP